MLLHIHYELRAAGRASPAINGFLAPDRLDQLGKMSMEDDLRVLATSMDVKARQFCDRRRADLEDDAATRLLWAKAEARADGEVRKK